jgi:hypothetical protein
MLILLSLRQRPSRSHNGTIAAAPRLVAMLVLRKIVIWWPIDRHHVRSSLRRRQCGGDRRCSLRRLNGRPSSYRSCKLFTLANVAQALGLGLVITPHRLLDQPTQPLAVLGTEARFRRWRGGN